MSDSSYVGFVYNFVFHIFTLGFLRSISNLISVRNQISLPWSEENYIYKFFFLFLNKIYLGNFFISFFINCFLFIEKKKKY